MHPRRVGADCFAAMVALELARCSFRKGNCMKLTRRTVLKATAASMIAPAVARAIDDRQTPDPRNVLWYEQPAREWIEALPVGNGRLGAMVFGGIERERLQLNEDTLWGGGPYDPANPQAREALPEVRKLVFAGEYEEATELVTAKVMATPLRQMSYQTVGELRLAFPGLEDPSSYRRELDIDGALATTGSMRAGRHSRAKYLRARRTT